MTREAPAPGGTRRDSGPVPAGTARGAVIAFPVPEGNEALVVALRSQHPAARATLFERHAEHVRRILVRVLGLDQEIPDLLQEVFLTALTGVQKLEDPGALRPWLTSIAVRSARGLIRKRARRRILGLVEPERLDREIGPASGIDEHEAIRALYAVLDEMPADERIVFALRFVDGMDLLEIASACGISRATVSRRLARAERRFTAEARRYEPLNEWLERSARWGTTSNG
jgi:RNA polymerase sigma-70 factor (ECF subfamily)